MNESSSTADIARRLQDIAKEDKAPEWLKTQLLTIANHIGLIALDEVDDESPPEFIYPH